MRLCFAFIVLLVCLATGVHAAKIYTYRDANGNLAFSDRPLENAQQLEVKTAEHIDYQERFRVRDEGFETRRRVYGINSYYGPVEVEVRLIRQHNIATSVPLPRRFVVPGAMERELVQFWPRNDKRTSSYAFETEYVLGDPAAIHHPDAMYLVPLPPGKTFRVTQAFQGKLSHQGPQNAYAVDIATPLGTPIHAARSGVIMDVSNDFFSNGLTSDFAERANAIRILHDDGTMAVYAHLELESAQYPIGTRVEAGTMIARSGNTGYSTGPHLHFVVQQNVGFALRSVPFTFIAADGRRFTPQQGELVCR